MRPRTAIKLSKRVAQSKCTIALLADFKFKPR